MAVIESAAAQGTDPSPTSVHLHFDAETPLLRHSLRSRGKNPQMPDFIEDEEEDDEEATYSLHSRQSKPNGAPIPNRNRKKPKVRKQPSRLTCCSSCAR